MAWTSAPSLGGGGRHDRTVRPFGVGSRGGVRRERGANANAAQCDRRIASSITPAKIIAACRSHSAGNTVVMNWNMITVSGETDHVARYSTNVLAACSGAMVVTGTSAK